MEFSRRHPIVNLIYFIAVILISVFLMHPVLITISMVAAFGYMLMLEGGKRAIKSLTVILPVSALAAVLNVVFNHRGVTILAYFPNGNPITMEALLYGAMAAAMIAAVIWWFVSFSEIMTADKILCLFGNIIPAISLIFSMVLRFVPRLKKQLQAVYGIQKALGTTTGKIKGISSVVSAVTSWAIEGSVETADSMKARGFGTGKRTSYSVFSFTVRDLMEVIYILLLTAYIIVGKSCLQFEFYPKISYAELTLYQISVFVAFFMISIMPLFIEGVEMIRWKYLRSKI
ncbi:MAG: energy-coupling factor transporter transmembrane component T [Clostridia bacterium]|nr:energy-coupling factor transporter transmembrane component T [Clostridia bacterium]